MMESFVYFSDTDWLIWWFVPAPYPHPLKEKKTFLSFRSLTPHPSHSQPPQLSHSPWALVILRSLLLYVHRNHDYHRWGSPDYHLDFHTAPELWWFLVHCCFMSVETILSGLSGMGSPGLPPWLSHSPWALVILSSLLLYVRRDHKDSRGWGAQDGHLDFHTAPELSPVICQQNVGPANQLYIFMHCIIIINAFLMRQIPLRLYMCEAKKKNYAWKITTAPSLIPLALLCMHPHMCTHTRTRTISQPLMSPFCSQSLNTSHPPKIISQPVKTSAAKS